MTDTVLIPYGAGYLRLTQEEFTRAIARGIAPAPAPDAPPVSDGRLVDSAEMGTRIGCTAEHVEALAKRGEVPAVRIGRYLRFNPAAVLAALQARDVGNRVE
jgi:excisionase family DNA binding protein